MQMIDVLKRLAQLDAKNPNVIKESSQVAECGPMGMMDSMPGMGIDKPSVPANFSINASAATGNEVADMMSQILTLAGMKQVGAGDLGAEPQGAVVTAEPVTAVGPMAAEPMPTAADDMRSVLDKLNPEPAGDDKGEEGGELGPFQHDSDDGEEGGKENPFGGDDEGDEESDQEDDGEEETDEGQYDNSPSDPTDAPAADANEYAHQENQPGSGETSNGEKRQSNMPTATFEALMKEYKQFIGESEEDEEMDEAAEKTPTTWTDSKGNKHPATRVKGDKYTGKEAEKDEKKVKEDVDSTLDILKLAGLTK